MGNILMDQQTLHQLVIYDPETGDFTCKFTGNVVGYKIDRYTKIDLLGIKYWAHRLAWLYMTGDWPDQTDHIDGNGQNNRWINLRNCSRAQNLANADKRIRGIEAHGRKYRARLMVNRKRIELGSFDSFEDAVEAYDEALKRYHGQFARCNRPE